MTLRQFIDVPASAQQNKPGREDFVIDSKIIYPRGHDGRQCRKMNDGLTTPQSAVLGYRRVGNGLKILLVTSKTRGLWVLPKGMIAAGMTPAESAVKEAWEEAGVAGSITGECVGVYRYLKTRRCGVISCTVKVYAMRVTAVLTRWPEQRQRRRRWMSLDEAISTVANRDLKRLLILFGARHRAWAGMTDDGDDSPAMPGERWSYRGSDRRGIRSPCPGPGGLPAGGASPLTGAPRLRSASGFPSCGKGSRFLTIDDQTVRRR